MSHVCIWNQFLYDSNCTQLYFQILSLHNYIALDRKHINFKRWYIYMATPNMSPRLTLINCLSQRIICLRQINWMKLFVVYFPQYKLSSLTVLWCSIYIVVYKYMQVISMKEAFRWRFHWSLFLSSELTIFQHCFRKWLVAWSLPNHYLNQLC